MSDVPGPSALTSFPVVLEVPPEGSYLSVMRSAAAASAARLDFTIDEIEDLRIAVSEACSLLLADADRSAPLRCELRCEEDALFVAVTVRTTLPGVDRSSFAWMVLEALAGEADTSLDDGVLTLTLVKRRGGV